MAMVDERKLFTKFWEEEAKTTHKVLTRIPEGSDYKPDAKSRTAQTIAWQIVCEEKMIIESLESGKAEWAPPAMPAAMKDVLAAYEKQSAGMIERWKSLSDERWNGMLNFFGTERPAAPMAPPWADHHLSAADGIDRTADLRPERRRTIEREKPRAVTRAAQSPN